MISLSRLTAMVGWILCASLLWPHTTEAQEPKSGPAFAEFSPLIDLQGRHPHLVTHKKFKDWISATGISRWHETPLDDKDRQSVVIQGRDDSRLLAVQLKRDARGEESIEHIQAIDTKGTSNIRSEVLEAAKAKIGATKNVELHALRPVVTFSPKNHSLKWEVEVVRDDHVETYYLKAGRLQKSGIFSIPASLKEKITPTAEDTTSDDLHHLDQLRTEAMTWIQGASTVQEKVQRIFDRIKRSYLYDGTLVQINELTSSDLLVRNINRYRGTCDEWAVVQVSYLRAVGIPARMKFLVWTQQEQHVGHAVVEYDDGGTWRHVDALWNVFNAPERYRQAGANSLTVMDADAPLDSRSTVPAWGIPDPTGDGKLNPYRDFVITPAYPGNQRPGYSH